jgi:hypothetical protein
MLAQMRTVMFAGHETTANTLCWTLLELARHPEVQSRLRNEIRAAEREARSRGASELSTTDLDSMLYTMAVIKVCPTADCRCEACPDLRTGRPSVPPCGLQQLQGSYQRRCPSVVPTHRHDIRRHHMGAPYPQRNQNHHIDCRI